MMFSIVTTQEILEKLYLENSAWSDIVAQTKCFYVKPYNEWWEQDDQTPLIQLANGQADIKDGKDIFSELEIHPEVIAQYPSSVFILDISIAQAALFQQKFGVIVQSIEQLNDAIITTVSQKTIYTEEGDSGIGWNDVLRGIIDLPINALIINDRNLFTNDQAIKDQGGNVIEKRLSGVDNVYDILNTLLPRMLDVPFHILIICDKAGIEKHLTVKNVITYLNGLKRQLNRPYFINMELLAVSSQSSFYPKTHNRKILTNYGYLTFDHKINAFERGRSKVSQMISVNKLFSHDSLKSPSPFVKAHNSQIKDLREYVTYVNQHPSLAEHEFAKNGIAAQKFDNAEHRMIL